MLSLLFLLLLPSYASAMISNVGVVYKDETTSTYKYDIVWSPDGESRYRHKQTGQSAFTLSLSSTDRGYTGISIGKGGGTEYLVYSLSQSSVETLIATITFPSNMTGPNDYTVVNHNSPEQPPDDGGNPSTGSISNLSFNSANDNLNWSYFPECVGYQIYLNGNMIAQTPYNYYPIGQAGNYEVVGVDDFGKRLADSSINVTSEMLGNGDGGGNNPDDPYPPDDGGYNPPIGDFDPDNPYEPIPPSEDPFCSVCMAQLKRIAQDISYNTADALYELDDLNRTARQIRNAVEDSLGELRTLNQTASSIDNTTKSIDRELKDFHNQFKTNRSYPLPNANDYQIPEHVPQMHSGPFKDNNTYFTDSGSTASPPPLPKAMEPADNWNGIYRQDEQSRDKALLQSPVLKMDGVLQFDAPLQRSEILEKETFSRTNELERTETKERTGIFERSEPMKQEDNNFGLRWKMKEGVIVE